MKDPFPIEPIPWLNNAVQPLADALNLATFPLHVHEVLIAFMGYTLVERVVSPLISGWLFPEKYGALSSEKKLNWDVHVVSLVQSSMINTLSLWVLFADEERKHMVWQERVWGYTGAAGMIQGLATGYFLWDLIVSIIHVKAFGVGMLVHAMSALLVFSFGFRPFLNFYGCTFILYELSSPLLNFHWFFDKLGMTGSKAQLYNGILLLFVFFGCRLVWGSYQTVLVFTDMWTAIHHQSPVSARLDHAEITDKTFPSSTEFPGLLTAPKDNELMKFSAQEVVPIWLSILYLSSNLILNFLNFYWFRQMIVAIRKRFPHSKHEGAKIDSGNVKNAGTVLQKEFRAREGDYEAELRRRKVVDGSRMKR